MIESIAWQLVPTELPASVEPWVLHAAEQAKLDERQFRAFVWANSLLNQARNPGPVVRTAIVGAFEGDGEIADITAGFIPIASSPSPTKRELYLRHIQNAARRIRSAETVGLVWTFGIIIGVKPFVDSPFARPLVEREEITQLVYLDDVPVMCELRAPHALEMHTPIHPQGAATSTCFVRPAQGKRFYTGVWQEGILLARHVLGAGNAVSGTLVNMQSGPALPVIDVDADASTIDAAVLDAGSGSIPASAKQIPLCPAVAPGTQVAVKGAVTQFSADVLRIMDDSRYFGNLVAHRAVIDRHGAHGDSGAIVRETTNQEAVGLYIGQLPGPPAEGLVQLMRQVTKYFEVDLYD